MSTDNDEKESPWYLMWHALTYDLLEAEMNLYREKRSLLQNEWNEESKKYEEELTVTVKDILNNDVTITIPRRNYFNKNGTIDDVTLFPYHKALYPLLDAYDSLNVNIYHYNVLSVKASRPFAQRLSSNRLAFMDTEAEDSTLFLPCSYEAVSWTLGCYPGPDSTRQPDFIDGLSIVWFQMAFILLDHRHSFPPYHRIIVGEEQYFEKVLRGMIFESDDKSYNSNAKKWFTTGPYGPALLPRDRMERTGLLIKVLRHALSEMQRDYKLAAGVLVLMIRLRDPDDVRVFRQLLATIDSEYCMPSDRNQPDSYAFFTATCFHIIHTGIITFTDELSHCLSAFVRTTFLREFPLLLPDTNDDSVIGKRKKILVRAVVARQAEEYDDNDDRKNDHAAKIPVKFIATLIHSLGARGHLERVNQFDHIDTCTHDDTKYRMQFLHISLTTYECIVKALVSIANTVIQISPEGERYFGIASELVLALCRCLRNEDYFAAFRGGVDEYIHFQTHGYIDDVKYANKGVERLRPLRYTEGITNATAKMIEKRTHRRQYKLLPKESLAYMRDDFFEFFRQRPKQDVLDAVRGLFLRNLVDIRTSALGYGDFLVLCDYEITPLDPMLYWTEYAYPDEEGSDDDDDENDESLDEGDRPADWVKDEDGKVLTYNDLQARSNLQVLLLQRAWQAPWTPETHASFQQPYRAAVETTAKSVHRLGYPNEIMLSICSFLPRDWWEDARKECWNYACVSEKSNNVIARKMARDYNFSTNDSQQHATVQLQACPHCRAALYCSKSCRNRDLYLGHRGKCCPEVSKPPEDDEIQLYKKILVGSDGKSTLPIFLKSTCGAVSMDDCKESTMLDDIKAATMDDVQIAVEEEEDGDDESWETMESDEVADESTLSITRLIRKYFHDKSK